MNIICTDKKPEWTECSRRRFIKSSAAITLIPLISPIKITHAGWPAGVAAIGAALVAFVELLRFIREVKEGHGPTLRDEDGEVVILCIGCGNCLDEIAAIEEPIFVAEGINAACPVIER